MVEAPSTYTATWQNLTPKLTNEMSLRSSHGVVGNSEWTMVYGGETEARVPFDAEVRGLKGGEDQWRVLGKSGEEAPPMRIASAQVTNSGDNCQDKYPAQYMFGGRLGPDGQKEVPLNDMWKFQLEESSGSVSGKWEKIEQKGELPYPRSFHQLTDSHDRKSLYCFGGCANEGRMNDLHQFDIASSTWTKLPTSEHIKGRGGACFQRMGEKLYVICGFAGEPTRDVHLFSEGKWSRLADFPTDIESRSVCASAALPGFNLVCIFGGELTPSNKGHEGAGDFTNEVIFVTCDESALTFRPTMEGSETPMARGWLDCHVLKSTETKAKIIYHGGLTGDDENPVRMNDTWMLHIKKSQ